MKQDVKTVTVLSKWCCKEHELYAMLSVKSKQYSQYLERYLLGWRVCSVFAKQRYVLHNTCV